MVPSGGTCSVLPSPKFGFAVNDLYAMVRTISGITSIFRCAGLSPIPKFAATEATRIVSRNRLSFIAPPPARVLLRGGLDGPAETALPRRRQRRRCLPQAPGRTGRWLRERRESSVSGPARGGSCRKTQERC